VSVCSTSTRANDVLPTRVQCCPPAMSEDNEVTLLLSALTRGDDGAASKLIPVVYDELRRLAASYMEEEARLRLPFLREF
jgi:hypothetical protein